MFRNVRLWVTISDKLSDALPLSSSLSLFIMGTHTRIPSRQWNLRCFVRISKTTEKFYSTHCFDTICSVFAQSLIGLEIGWHNDGGCVCACARLKTKEHKVSSQKLSTQLIKLTLKHKLFMTMPCFSDVHNKNTMNATLSVVGFAIALSVSRIRRARTHRKKRPSVR